MSSNRLASLRSHLPTLWGDPAIRLILALAVLVTVGLNLPYYLTYRALGAPKMSLAIASSAVSTLCFFLVISAHRYVLHVLLPLTLMACGAAAYFLVELGVYINENTLGLVYETNWHEASSLLSPTLIALVLVVGALSVGAAHLIARQLENSQTPRRLGWAGFLFTAHLLAALQTKAIEVYDPPLGLVTNSYVYFREANRATALLKSRRDISSEARFLSHDTDDAGDFTIVFVVGESLRPDHLHFNGYPRTTTPKLEKLGVVSFPDVAACATNTRFAVPCMLTRGTKETPRLPYSETSFISVFRKLGFDTSWLSLQGRFWEGLVSDEYTVAATAAIADEAETVRYLNASGDLHRSERLDSELLPPLDTALARPARKKLILLHQIGTHFHYGAHYPTESSHYEPVCLNRSPRRCDLNGLNNAYDNAVRYQDEILSSIIERLQDKNALFLYVADHGESLGEGGVFLHHVDSKEPEQNRVAMFVWASETYRQNFPRRWASLTRNRKKRLAHEHVFHTVLDCSGINIPEVNLSKSLCRDAQERTQELPPNRLSIALN